MKSTGKSAKFLTAWGGGSLLITEVSGAGRGVSSRVKSLVFITLVLWSENKIIRMKISASTSGIGALRDGYKTLLKFIKSSSKYTRFFEDDRNSYTA